MSKTKTPNTKQAIIGVLSAAGEATVAQIALSAGVGRSTAGKLLTQLESDGEARRTERGRDGNRRLPDLWSLAGKQPASVESERKNGSAPAELPRRAQGQRPAWANTGRQGAAALLRRRRQLPRAATERQTGQARHGEAPPLQHRLKGWR